MIKPGDRITDDHEGWSGVVLPDSIRFDGNGWPVGCQLAGDRGWGAGTKLTVDLNPDGVSLTETAPGEFSRAYKGA